MARESSRLHTCEFASPDLLISALNCLSGPLGPDDFWIGLAKSPGVYQFRPYHAPLGNSPSRWLKRLRRPRASRWPGASAALARAAACFERGARTEPALRAGFAANEAAAPVKRRFGSKPRARPDTRAAGRSCRVRQTPVLVHEGFAGAARGFRRPRSRIAGPVPCSAGAADPNALARMIAEHIP